MQQIWDEVGESDEERDKMLLQLEEDCFDVYKRKISHAVKSRAQLLQELADAKAELSSLQASLGEEKSGIGIVSDCDCDCANIYSIFQGTNSFLGSDFRLIKLQEQSRNNLQR